MIVARGRARDDGKPVVVRVIDISQQYMRLLESCNFNEKQCL